MCIRDSYRHVSQTIDSPLHVPLQDRSGSIGTYRWQRFSRPVIVQYLSLPIGGKCTCICSWTARIAIQNPHRIYRSGVCSTSRATLSRAGHKAVLFRSGAENGSSANPESSKHKQLMRVAAVASLELVSVCRTRARCKDVKCAPIRRESIRASSVYFHLLLSVPMWVLRILR